jgi:hypothetical protein
MENNEHVPAHGGGPRTEEGKATSCLNALTHGMLRDALTEYEQGVELTILDDLRREFFVEGALENILLERIAVHYVKLNRIAKAEREFIRSVLNPRKVTRHRTDEIGMIEEALMAYEETVENEGYVPQVGAESVERLYGIYGRYETNVENRMYRAIHELLELRKLRAT